MCVVSGHHTTVIFGASRRRCFIIYGSCSLRSGDYQVSPLQLTVLLTWVLFYFFHSCLLLPGSQWCFETHILCIPYSSLHEFEDNKSAMINLYGSSDIPTQYLRATALQQPIDGLAQQYLYYHELRRNAAITHNPTTGRKTSSQRTL